MAALNFPNSPAAGQKYIPGPNQPVYTFDGEKWTTLDVLVEDAGIPVGASSITPLPNAATGSPGTELAWSHGNHVHPTDATRAPLHDPVFTGDARAETPAPTDNDTSIATTAFVVTAVTVLRSAVQSELAELRQLVAQIKK